MKYIFNFKILFIIVLLCIRIVSEGTVLPEVISDKLILTINKSPYYAQSDITVTKSGILEVNEGVEIRFTDTVDFTINGILRIRGTLKDPVYIIPDTGFIPAFLKIENTTGHCFLRHLKMKDVRIYSDYANISMDFVTIENDLKLRWDDALCRFKRGDIRIRKCKAISNGTGEGFVIEGYHLNNTYLVHSSTFINVPDAIELIQADYAIIVLNRILNSGDDGIDLDGAENVLIRNNYIYGSFDNGITVGNENFGPSDTRIERNLIVGCGTGITSKDGSSAFVLNNTLFDNALGIKAYEEDSGLGGASIIVINTIIASSDINYDFDVKSAIQFYYSLVNSGSLPGSNNLIADPGFISIEDSNYHLKISSDCIDSGDPSSDNDADNTRADIGAFPYNSTSDNILINEINYNSDSTTEVGDWIEIYNKGNYPFDISRYGLIDEGDSAFIFPEGSVIEPDSYLVVCSNSEEFASYFIYVDNFTGNLMYEFSDVGEQLKLIDIYGTTFDSVDYGVSSPWPAEANGEGPTLELLRPEYDNSLPQSWSASQKHGTPGRKNFIYNKLNRTFERNTELKIYPNPFFDKMTVKLNLKSSGEILFELYSMDGRKIFELNKGYQLKGKCNFQIEQNIKNDGIYLLDIKLNGISLGHKMVVRLKR